jgi:hypothetical protein
VGAVNATFKFPVDPELMKALSPHEHLEILGAIWNMLDAAIEDLTSGYVDPRIDPTFRWALGLRNDIEMAMERFEPGIVQRSKKAWVAEQERLAEACMHL